MWILDEFPSAFVLFARDLPKDAICSIATKDRFRLWSQPEKRGLFTSFEHCAFRLAAGKGVRIHPRDPAEPPSIWVHDDGWQCSVNDPLGNAHYSVGFASLGRSYVDQCTMSYAINRSDGGVHLVKSKEGWDIHSFTLDRWRVDSKQILRLPPIFRPLSIFTISSTSFGVFFPSNGCVYVWERSGLAWTLSSQVRIKKRAVYGCVLKRLEHHNLLQELKRPEVPSCFATISSSKKRKVNGSDVSYICPTATPPLLQAVSLQKSLYSTWRRLRSWNGRS